MKKLLIVLVCFMLISATIFEIRRIQEIIQFRKVQESGMRIIETRGEHRKYLEIKPRMFSRQIARLGIDSIVLIDTTTWSYDDTMTVWTEDCGNRECW